MAKALNQRTDHSFNHNFDNSQLPTSNSQATANSRHSAWELAEFGSIGSLYNAPVEPRILTPEQFLLTLLVKLAAMAVLATMLARYRRFRHILIFERRGWVDRLVFTLSLGVPLMAGVTEPRHPELRRRRPDARRRLPGRTDRRSVHRRARRPAGRNARRHRRRIHRAALRRRLRVCRRRPARGLPEGSDLAVHAVRLRGPAASTSGRCSGSFEPNWQLVLLLAPVALELLRQALGTRFGAERLFYLGSPSPWMTLVVVLATVLAVATPIKIWNSARIEHRLQEQEKLLLAAKIEALKSQINPHFLFNTLTSISSLIRSQPDTARTLIIKLSALLRRLLRSHQHFVTLREELESIDEYLDIEVIRFGPKLRVRKGDRPGHARRGRAEHDPAAARRELDQARASRGRSAPARSRSAAIAKTAARSSRSKTTGWDSCWTG